MCSQRLFTRRTNPLSLSDVNSYLQPVSAASCRTVPQEKFTSPVRDLNTEEGKAGSNASSTCPSASCISASISIFSSYVITVRRPSLTRMHNEAWGLFIRPTGAHPFDGPECFNWDCVFVPNRESTLTRLCIRSNFGQPRKWNSCAFVLEPNHSPLRSKTSQGTSQVPPKGFPRGFVTLRNAARS